MKDKKFGIFEYLVPGFLFVYVIPMLTIGNHKLFKAYKNKS